MTRLDRIAALHAAARDRILVLDGAWGVMIQRESLSEEDFRGEVFAQHHMPLKGDNDILCLTRPALIADLHDQYYAAGADISETNTFSATTIAQADYGLERIVTDLNLAAARTAREVADRWTAKEPHKPRFVAGSIGPTNRTLSISPDVNDPGARGVTFDQVYDAYREQALALHQGGVDLFLVETIFDTLNAKAAIKAIMDLEDDGLEPLPIWISGTITDRSGRTLSGQTVEAFWNSVKHAKPFAVGFNCALGAELMRPHIAEISRLADTLVAAYPNAGLPNAFGEYDEEPHQTGHMLARMGRGRHRQHPRRLLRHDAGSHPPCGAGGGRAGAARSGGARGGDAAFGPGAAFPPSRGRGAGMRPVFINIGERTNVTGSAKFKKLVVEGDYPAALSVARQQVEAGAQIIDINMDEGLLDSEKAMVTFLNLIAAEPDIARVPVMIDSSKWNVIEAGLKCVQGKSIVNSISMKEGEEKFLEQARQCLRYGAAVVVMAFDEVGQADTADRKVEICQRAYKLLTEEVGFPPEDIIFDPNIFAVATGIDEHKPTTRSISSRRRRGSSNPCPTRGFRGACRTSRSASGATSRCAGRSTRCSSITPSTPAWTWASSTPATCRSTTTSTPSCARRWKM